MPIAASTDRGDQQRGADDQEREPGGEKRCEAGSGGREKKAECEQREDGGAEHEPAADSERGQLSANLQHGELGLEPGERARPFCDLVDHRSDAVSAGGHGSASRSLEQGARPSLRLPPGEAGGDFGSSPSWSVCYPGRPPGKQRPLEADEHNGRFMTTVEEKAGSGGGRVSKEGLRGFFREMLLIRRFEEKVEERFRAGELPGFLHVAIGQEAAAAGVCAALEREDVIASTHRAHGHSIAKGTPIERVMAELYGKIEGCSHGYGGSMHLYDVEVGNLGANAVVAGGIPGIVGAALAFQMRNEKRVAVAFFGDGATNTGTFHESLNLAQLWKVPAVFVLENNGWAESTPAKQHLPLPVDELGKRALAYGMKLIEADGQDVEAVYLAALAAREHAVLGSGPVLLHLRTFRLVGHYVGDPQIYREKEELEETRETKDPIELLRARLELSEDEFTSLDAEIIAEVEASVEFAKAGTDPKPEDALANVYANA